MKKLRVGLCGLGFMGGAHLAAYSRIRDVEVVGVCHASSKRFSGTTSGNISGLGGGREILRTARRYNNLAEMLSAERIDLVDICTPTFTHADLACRAFKAGAHVLCEKPLALTVSECNRMIQASRKARRFLMAAHCLRWWPEYVYLHGLARSKKFGALKSLHMFRGSMATKWASWMSDEHRSGGPLLDLHIHDLDQMLWICGKPSAVSASHSRGRRAGSALYRYADLVVISEYNGNLAGGFVFNMSYRAQFERATLVFDFSQKKPLTLWAGGKSTQPKLPAASAYDGEIRYMIDCVRRGKAPSHLTPGEARDGVALAHLERKAGTEGRWVSIKL